MTNPHRYSLFMIGAAVLATAAPVLADTGPEKQPAVVTVEMGPQGPTAAEIAKLEAITAERAAAPATDPATAVVSAPIVSPPMAEKKAEVATIVVGPAGLTPAEQAKVTATVVPAPAPVTPAPAEKE